MKKKKREQARLSFTHLIPLPILAAVSLLVTVMLCIAPTTVRGGPETAACNVSQKVPVKSQNTVMRIVDPTTQYYNYDRLILDSKDKDKQYIIVKVQSKSNLKVIGSIEVPKLVAQDDKNITLALKPVQSPALGKLEKHNREMEVKAATGENTLIFELMKVPVMLKLGTYQGDLTLTPIDGDKQAIKSSLVLVVDTDVNIVDSNKDYDYLDLVSRRQKVLVAASLRNKGGTAISATAILKGHSKILSKKGTPVELNFHRVELSQSGWIDHLNLNEKSFAISPGQAVRIYFELEKPEIPPAGGRYKVFLVVHADDGTQIVSEELSIHIPSKLRIGASSLWTIFKTWLVEWPQRMSLSLIGRKVGVDSFIFYLLLIPVAYLWREFILWCRRRHLGTITVEKSTNATGDDKIKVEGIDAMLKYHLEELGLAPPKPQPLVSAGADLSSVLTTTLQTGFPKVSKEILLLVWSILWPRIGHRVAMTLYDGPNEDPLKKVGAVVEIRSAITSKSEEIKEVSADSADAVARKAAYFIYMHVIQKKQILKHTPNWRRFTTLEGLELYLKGKEKQKKEGMTEEAIKYYRQARAPNLEVNNGLILQSLGGALEDVSRFFEAMEVYLQMVTRWPEIIAARYRLAVMLSYYEKLLDQYEKASKERQKTFLDSLRCYIEEDKSIPAESKKVLGQEKPSKDHFLKLAALQWAYLLRALKWHSCFRNWFGTLTVKWRTDIRHYLWMFSRPWPWGVYRRQYQFAAQLAQYCTKIQANPATVQEVIAEMKKLPLDRSLSRWRGIDWVVRYNAACVYSRSLALVKEKSYEKSGVDLLRKVVSDPESASVRNWLLFVDPDLVELRKSDAFRQLECELGVTGHTPKVLGQAPPPDSVAQGWELLRAGADVRRTQWEEHQKTLLGWSKPMNVENLRSIRKWYQHETDIWAAISDLASNPEDSKYQKVFWDELMRGIDQAAVTQLPPLSDKTGAENLMTYKRRWHQLSERARKIQHRWDSAEDEIRLMIVERQVTCSKENVGNMIETAIEVWHTLKNWAFGPLAKEHQDIFLKATQTGPSGVNK